MSIAELKEQLRQRDKQIEEQAAPIKELEKEIRELKKLLDETGRAGVDRRALRAPFAVGAHHAHTVEVVGVDGEARVAAAQRADVDAGVGVTDELGVEARVEHTADFRAAEQAVEITVAAGAHLIDFLAIFQVGSLRCQNRGR